MKTVVIIDYGMGNLRSVAQAVAHVAAGENIEVLVSDRPEDVKNADRIVLPGQGAMRHCMDKLRESGLQEAVWDAISNKPVLGVCVGMQMLLDGSEEAGGDSAYTPSLGLIAGTVKRFDLAGQTQPDGSRFKVPQMGWNQVAQMQPHALWQGIADQTWFYFVHSYYAQPQRSSDVVGQTVYGHVFASVVARDNVFATQFHPEKSAAMGLALYRNFLFWRP